MSFIDMYIDVDVTVIKMVADDIDRYGEETANATMAILVREIERLQSMQ